MRIEIVLAAMWLGTAALAGAQEYSYEYQDGERVESARRDVLSRPEFEPLRREEEDEEEDAKAYPEWLERFLDWIESWFDGEPETSDGSLQFGGGSFIFWVAVVIVLAVLAFLIGTLLQRAEEKELPEAPGQAGLIHAGAAPGETPPDELWQRAQALAARGDYKNGIRQLLLAAMSTLERGGRIRHRKGLTNRDYVWAAAAGTARDSLLVIVRAFERVYFGRRDATPEGFEACANAYRDGFRAESVEAP